MIRKDNQANKTAFDNITKTIKRRIIEIENFYENNFSDSKIIHFEKIRINLKKLLQYSPITLNMLDSKSILVSKENIKESKKHSLKSEIIIKSSSIPPREKSVKSLKSNKSSYTNFYNNHSNWKDVHFKLVLNEKEYKELLKKKANNIRI